MNEDNKIARERKKIANIGLAIVLISLLALGIGLGIGMGLPWWITLLLLCFAATCIGAGMFVGFKVFSQMQDWGSKK